MASSTTPTAPAFEFQRDTFAYRNELVWDYQPEGSTGRMVTRRVNPPPTYAHHCFVMVRAVRQFLHHARFEPTASPLDPGELRARIRTVMQRSPRRPSRESDRVLFPGFPGLRALSRTHEAELKATCGGAWQSYVLRSHWRMVFPFSREHQARQARRLVQAIRAGYAPIVHLARFPSLTINHGILLFGVEDAAHGTRFVTYDPNLPDAPSTLTYEEGTRTFGLAPSIYFGGGRVDVFEIYRSWIF